MSREDLEQQILKLLRKHAGRVFRLSEILNELDAGKKQRRQIRRALDHLVREEQIELFRNKHYGLPRPKEELHGILEVSGKSYRIKLFARPTPDVPPLVTIKKSDIGSAMHGDKVAIRLTSRTHRGIEPRAVVTRVLERSRKTLAGRFQFTGENMGIVQPRDERIKRLVSIPRIPQRIKVHNDDWVVAKITDYPPEPERLVGTIKEVIGSEDQPGADIYIIIRDHGVEPEFPRTVVNEAEDIPDTPVFNDISMGRRDLRHIKLFTIDPSTAKDFDDALSIERLPDGLFRLGVHIADVSYYVKPNTALDREALDRSTSIYPIDRVVPMLPEKLSNMVCSLRPDEDRAAFSVFMDIDTDGVVVRSDIFPSIIRSRYRMTYEEVEAIYDVSDHWITTRYTDVLGEMALLFELTPLLIARRDGRGRLDLDIPEGEIVFDSAGAVIDVKRSTRLFSHRVVEEAMLLANETVAEYLTERGLPCVYRIHEPPDRDKIETLGPALKTFGIDLGGARKGVSPRRLQQILSEAERIEQGWIVRRLILRSMKRAIYSEENKGHFGIATDCYCHFTSPIRRYPDVMVHRILREAVNPVKISHEQISRWESELPEISVISSNRERRAEEIEREAFTIKSLEFMKQQTGEVFEATISTVVPWGFYVELDLYPVEGLVGKRLLPAGQYEYIEEAQILRSVRGKRKFRLGGRVTVSVDRVDTEKGHLDFRLVE